MDFAGLATEPDPEAVEPAGEEILPADQIQFRLPILDLAEKCQVLGHVQ